MDIFWGHHKIGRYKVYNLGSLKVKVQNRGYLFGVAKTSNIFVRCLKFLIFFGGERLVLGPSLRMKRK